MKKFIVVLFALLSVVSITSCKNEIPEVITLTIDCENIKKGELAYYVFKIDDNYNDDSEYLDTAKYLCFKDLIDNAIKTSLDEKPMSKSYFLNNKEYRLAIITFKEAPQPENKTLYKISTSRVLEFNSDIKVTILNSGDIIVY